MATFAIDPIISSQHDNFLFSRSDVMVKVLIEEVATLRSNSVVKFLRFFNFPETFFPKTRRFLSFPEIHIEFLTGFESYPSVRILGLNKILSPEFRSKISVHFWRLPNFTRNINGDMSPFYVDFSVHFPIKRSLNLKF